MKTPKEYTENIKNHVITADMFSDCLYSVNKRAKNYRDNARAQRSEFGRHAMTEANDHNKEKYYAEKDFLLQFLKPVAVHREFAGYERRRIYDYEKDYSKYIGQFVWENCFYDYEKDGEVWFGDIELKDKPKYRYYLYYVLGNHSFHSPCSKEEADLYNELPKKELEDFETFGADTCNLLSCQFVNKLMLELCGDNYVLSFDGTTDKRPIIDHIPSFVQVPEHTNTQMFHAPAQKIETIKSSWNGSEEPYFDFICRIARKTAGKENTLEYAASLGMQVKSNTLMKAGLEWIRDHGNILKFASEYGIGVEKPSYIKAGMSESVYRKSRSKLRVVGSRQWSHGYKNTVNEYDIAQYLQWRNTGEL